MLKQVFLAHFELVVSHFGPWKMPKCLENGPFSKTKMGQKWLKNAFSQEGSWTIPDAQQVFLARFEPVVTRFGPYMCKRCLENVLFWDEKWLKNGLRKHSSKSDLGPFGVLKQVFLAHFEPLVTLFGL